MPLSSSWTFDGVSLETAAHNIRLLSPDEMVPARRGRNVVIPGRVGSLHRTKVFSDRVIALEMWVTGQTAAAMQSDLETLQKLFGSAGERELRRIMANGSIRRIDAEVVNAVTFKPRTESFATFIVEFLCAYPFWSSCAIWECEVGISDATTTFTVDNRGTVENDRATVIIEGAITDPKLAIGDTWVKYTGTVASGETLTIDVDAFTADLDGTDVTDKITHGGAVAWLVLPTGANTATLTGTGVSGARVEVRFNALYF